MTFALVLHVLIILALGYRILLRPNREADSRMAWLLIVIALPYLGAVAYILLGETDIGHDRRARLHAILARMPSPAVAPGWDEAAATPHLNPAEASLFSFGHSISQFAPVGSNQAELLPEGDPVIARMIADIDAARQHVHVLFYIWLADGNGTQVLDALKRAAARGVTCRAMVDGIGSRSLIRSQHWSDLAAAGVKTAVALRPENPLLPMVSGRIDLRNHRKVVVIDNAITYCGSQNCCDPAYLPKARFGPWVDAVMRFTGPIVRQNQHVFCTDWMESADDDLTELLHEPMPPSQPGFTAQVVATGPTIRASAMPEMFASVINAARQELFITTPYFVPDGALLAAVRMAGYRGVDTTIIFPARNDDFAVGGASRSHYEDLLTAGVKIFEFQPGLLHTKSITADGHMILIGSANMDRRSFDLNYENNILLDDVGLTAAMRARQQSYLERSRPISLSEVQAWSAPRRLSNNILAMIGPVL